MEWHSNRGWRKFFLEVGNIASGVAGTMEPSPASLIWFPTIHYVVAQKRLKSGQDKRQGLRRIVHH
jgi:hypothetical protein